MERLEGVAEAENAEETARYNTGSNPRFEDDDWAPVSPHAAAHTHTPHLGPVQRWPTNERADETAAETSLRSVSEATPMFPRPRPSEEAARLDALFEAREGGREGLSERATE